ncbi:hypothetical protein DH2020_019721 [Rehmannia glutinosa]|uniref:Cellulose synthase-like protein n=1 Tax=Rehmannia glutinosa TaxID=99300 RepID=A0ABR0WEJ7_REHGL
MAAPTRQSSSVEGGGPRYPPPSPPQSSVKFTRRTSSGRFVSLSRDDELDVPGDYSTQNDYINYTVLMPPTPDNQPGGAEASGDKADGPALYNAPSSRLRSDSRRIGVQGGGSGDGGGGGKRDGKLDRRMSVIKNNDKSMLLRSHTQDFDHNRWLFESKGKYGIGNAFWQNDDSFDHDTGMSMQDFIDKPWKPLTRKIQVSPGVISPYRVLIVLRMIALGFYLTWRIQNPNQDAMWLWGLSLVCEIWFSFSWLLDILPKFNPIDRAADLVALKDKFETPSQANPNGRSDLPGVDVFITTVDPEKEPPLVTANTILSILAVEYPIEKLSIYISDDGGAILTFESMAEAVWVPFCRKHNIEPRNPDSYFSQKMDRTKNKKRPDFVKDRRWIKREYDEFKVRINGLPDVIRKRCDKYNKDEELKEKKLIRDQNDGVLPPDHKINVTKATWMADGTHWPGMWYNPTADHSKEDHAGILQIMSKVPDNDPVMGGPDEGRLDFTGIDTRLPMFAYVSREKRKCYDHNKKAGAMNALVRASAILSNGAFILNVDYDHYIYNSMAIREGMCYMIDRGGDRVCFIQFPQRFDGIDPSDRYANHNTVFYDGSSLRRNWMHVQTICTLRFSSTTRANEYQGRPLADHFSVKNGRHPGALIIPRPPLDAHTVAEAVAVISCWYEENTEWGDRIGWIYGSAREDVLTGYRMHNRGWRSVYCITKRDAFRGTAPINLTDRLHQVLRWAIGSVEIFFSRNNPILASPRLKFLQRLAYLNIAMYPFSSIFLVVYCFLPALSLFTGEFIVQSLDIVFLFYVFIIVLALTLISLLEVKWSGIGLEEWWRNEQFWVIGGTSAHLVAVLQGLLKIIVGIEIKSESTSQSTGKNEEDDIYADLHAVKWTGLFIMPLIIIIVNLVALVIGFATTVYSVIPQWSKLFRQSFFCFWVLAHMYPFAKGLMGRKGKVPTIIYVWAGLISITVSLLYIVIKPPQGDSKAPTDGDVNFKF